MKGCNHDVIYSGQTNLSQKFAYICRRCGECGWDSRYVISRVNFDEYCRQRVRHGWATPPQVQTAGSARRRQEQAQRAHAERRGWWFPLIANALALVTTIAAAIVVRPRSPYVFWAMLLFMGLMGVSWWKLRRKGELHG